MSWGIGDLGYNGWVRIWYGHDESGEVWWYYSLRIKSTNYYCVDRKRQGDPAYKGKRSSRVRRVW